VKGYLNATKGKASVTTDFLKKWLPTVDNLRNFLLTTTTEMLSFFQQLGEAP
jgi:hypothetical protein